MESRVLPSTIVVAVEAHLQCDMCSASSQASQSMSAVKNAVSTSLSCRFGHWGKGVIDCIVAELDLQC